MSSLPLVNIKPLTKAAFAPFGDVIEMPGADHFPINNGFTERYHRLSTVGLAQADDKAIINIFASRRWADPVQVTMLEQHPLGSQAFMPLDNRPFLIVVADKTETGEPRSLHVFVTNGQQGVNYGIGVWHHPLLIIAEQQNFLVVDRSGSGKNLMEVNLPNQLQAQIDLQPLIDEFIEA